MCTHSHAPHNGTERASERQVQSNHHPPQGHVSLSCKRTGQPDGGRLRRAARAAQAPCRGLGMHRIHPRNAH
eukprot:6185148-Pleurochrysis_carterae.AAC.1